MILHGIEYQRPTSLNMRILADHVTYSFLAFMKSIFHFCLGCYCGGYSQNGRSNLSSFFHQQWGNCPKHKKVQQNLNCLCCTLHVQNQLLLVPGKLFQTMCGRVIWPGCCRCVDGAEWDGEVCNDASCCWNGVNETGLYPGFMFT